MKKNINSIKAIKNELDIICTDCSKGQPDNKFDRFSLKCLECKCRTKNSMIYIFQDNQDYVKGLRSALLEFLVTPNNSKNESDKIILERTIQKINNLSGPKLVRLFFESKETLNALYADNNNKMPLIYIYVNQLLFDKEKNRIENELRIQKLEEIMKNAKRRCKTKPSKLI